MNTPTANPRALFAPQARLPQGWASDVLLCWDRSGTLERVACGASQALLDEAMHTHGLARAHGPVLPGMPNLHSHAFQSAMAGLTEYRANAADSFWSWRDLMYRFSARITPHDMGAIAEYLYMQMLKAGYTAVCEFHYIHHQPDGSPYADRAEMAARVVRAAETAGIGITMLPVLYQYSNIGGEPPRPDQARFINSPDGLLELLAQLRSTCPGTPDRRYGVAPHSLRAVTKASLHTLLAGLRRDTPDAPVHIHIAEQQAEVDACLAGYGARPVQWLLDNFDIDSQWCLVHATHMDERETAAAARCGAVAGLCPTTEANLGDGLFPAVQYLGAGGRFGVGSDSHISIDWRAELRLLEYGQRLTRRERNVLASYNLPIVAERLFDEAAHGGAIAAGRAIGELRAGCRADLIVLDADHPHLAEQQPAAWLSGLVFSEIGGSAIRDVYTGGQQRIAEGRHPQEDRIFSTYRQTLAHLLKG